TEDQPREEERPVLVPEPQHGGSSVARAEGDGGHRHRRDRHLDQKYGDEVAEQALEWLDREAEVDQVPVAEQHSRRDPADHQGAGHDGDGVEGGGRAERGSQTEAEGAEREREDADQERGGEGSRPEQVRLAPQRGEIHAEGGRERGPYSELEQRTRIGSRPAQQQRDPAAEIQQREPEVDARARSVEPTIEDAEGGHAQARAAPAGERAKKKKEAVAEPRHGVGLGVRWQSPHAAAQRGAEGETRQETTRRIA